ncbi:type IV secretory system conjugative DNA transfer family protein, partial [Rhizobium rhizogenes]
LALPYIAAVAIGIIGLFAANGSANIKAAGLSVLAGSGVVITIATLREVIRLNSIASSVPAEQSVLAYADPVTMIGASIAFISGMFALRVAIKGNAAFATTAPKRIGGKRAVHGEADWMKIQEAAKLFPERGGIIIGERYRVDRDSVAAMPFRADDRQSWGAGGKSPLLCFDGSFGSSHGIVFAGSGGFKTTSVTIPTALKWGGGLVVLD